MHQQHDGRIARAFVDMGDAHAAHVGVMGRVGKVRQVGKARFRCAQHVSHVGEGGQVTVSIGIVNNRSEPGGFEKLYRAADQALYAAKRDGRNRVSLFLPDISAVEWANPAKRA